MLKQLLIALLIATSLSSCAQNIQETNWCDEDTLILISSHDVLTPGTARQILVHNEEGKAVCGW